MRGKAFYILAIILGLSSILAQNKFEFDYARFYNPNDSSGYMELYYSFQKPGLQIKEIDGEQIRQGVLSVKIKNQNTQEVVIDNSWYLDVPVEEGANNLLVGVLDFPLEFANYSLEVIASDVNNSDYKIVNNVELPIQPYVDGQLLVSDIELATGIIQGSQNTESIFFKNSLEITPNPSLVYGDSNPVLFFYSEIYGISDELSDTYDVSQKLFDSNKKVVFEKHRKVGSKNSSIVEVGAIRVNNLNSGVYTLIVSVSDKSNLVSTHSAKKVYVYNKDLVDESTTFVESNMNNVDPQIMIMSEEELNYMAETSSYLATEFEKEQWKKLKDIESKKNYLTQFWKKRDSDPSTTRNEFRENYYNRLKYANRNFGNMSRREGWKTDRGRVYLTYGVPGEIERFQNESYTDPYEIWQYYDLEGGVLFLFADEEGLNIYRLIHSSKKGEIYNYRAYQNYIQRNN